ncbi:MULTISPECIES: DUF262 domain-containing protein [Brevibacillus]|uniref:GmrSD restriction endonuclease domain-containing protein n=1 Tax=Brevibacillus TaxID=55080 RepID=UPI00362C2DDD
MSVNVGSVNLDHLIPSESLLTIGEYQKMPKSEEAQLHKKDYLEFRDFLIDESGLGIWDRLRKPEFQRPTNSWNDEKYVNLLKTLRGNQVIPGVIFWLNTLTGHIFVLDGAHRLSAIRAWVTDDWGDSVQAREYGYLEEDEINASKRMREKIKSSVGSFNDCKLAAGIYRDFVNKRKNAVIEMDKERESLGKFMYNLNTSLRIPIQWVTGDYEDAEQSFININTGGIPLSDEEVLYLNNRRSPVSRAMTGIISNGSKTSLWLDHEAKCIELSKKLYDILLLPSNNTPEKMKVTDYPLCLLKKQNSFDRFVFIQHLFTIANHGQTDGRYVLNTLSKHNDEARDYVVANATLQQLEKMSSMISHITGKQPQSLGIFPVFYFYTSRGQFQKTFFMLFLMWIIKGTEEEVKERKLKFTLVRDQFEDVWMIFKDYFLKALGRKTGPSRLTIKFTDILDNLLDEVAKGKQKGVESFDIAKKYLKGFDYHYYKKFLEVYEGNNGKAFKPFSEGIKLQQEMYAFFEGTYRCEICGGTVELGSHQMDHREQRSEGGTNDLFNGRPVHPWCNNMRNKIEAHGGKRVKSFQNKGNTVPILKPAPDPSGFEQLSLF